VSNNH
jgi:hypothetical protein